MQPAYQDVESGLLITSNSMLSTQQVFYVILHFGFMDEMGRHPDSTKSARPIDVGNVGVTGRRV
jgi:hypothetical protein